MALMEKNQRLTLECQRLGSELEGVCAFQGMTVFVPGALPGETIEAQIVKVFPRYAFGKLLQVLTPSPQRARPLCAAYEKCGGCSGQHMSYEATLEAKRAQAADCFRRIGGFALPEESVPPVLGAAEPFHCRNKTALPVAGTWQKPELGFYRRRSHQVIPLETCPIAMLELRPLLETMRAWIVRFRVQPYDEETGRGLLRHVVVRSNRAGEAMALLVTTQEELPGVAELVEMLREAVPGFRALHQSVNRARNNVILGPSSRLLWGEESLTETLLGLEFEIAPLSFFQVNPAQCETLYRKAIEMAALRPEDTAVDAYAGAGTISLCMAKAAKRAVGIEIVPQAVEAARRNARRNGVENAEFHLGAVEEILPRLVNEGLRPDVILLDPPRKGVEPPVIEATLRARPRRVVYVSCHVPTQARDARLLAEGGYRLDGFQPVDMFCYAGGVECVAAFSREGDAAE